MHRSPVSEGRLRRIESAQNTRVKELRHAFKEAAPNEQGEVAVEGMHLLEEAIRSGLRLSSVFFSDAARDRAHKLLPQLSSHAETLLLPDAVFSGAVPTEAPQGVAAFVRVRSFTFEEILAVPNQLLVIVAGVQDPGNLGTIARSAEAFGATGLLLGEGTVSAWNGKAVRASAGSMFRLPTAKIDLLAAMPEIKSRGIRVLATSSHKGTALPEADLTAPMALLIGNEGAGLPKAVLGQADEIVAIPHGPQVESLNAAIAASVVLYEAARQRNIQPPRRRGTEI